MRCYALHRLVLLPERPVESGADRARAGARAEEVDGGRGASTRGELDDRWDAAIQRRLELFLGSENYDNRIDNGGLFDLEVLADLRRRYGNEADGLAPVNDAR